jgi:hypothetical protein
MSSARAVAGRDIGAELKGTHLVILRGIRIGCNLRKEAQEHNRSGPGSRTCCGIGA